MFSILIPIYNFDVRPLVEALVGQCRKELEGEFEILCFDDGSEREYLEKNRQLKVFPEVNYRELPQNLGRARIRNLLAESARFPYLLFMDNDSAPENEHYIANYRRAIRPDSVIYGGRTYQPKPPEDTELFFHWFYGSKREVKPAEERNLSPYEGFQTNNFLMPRDLFLSIKFDQTLLQYGHEDTLFGWELKKRGILIHHIENPLRHIGLEEVGVFLQKQKRAIQNLSVLYSDKKPVKTRLLDFYQKLEKLHLTRLFFFFWKLFRPVFKRNLKGNRPFLLLFDLYRLGVFIQYLDKQSKVS